MQKSRHIRKLLTLCLTVTLLATGVLSSGLLAQGPFDALTPDEIQLATKVLLSDAKVKESLGADRYRILYIERREHPKAVALTAERGALATLYNYSKDEALSVTVNLGKNPRVEIALPTKGLQPSISAEEIEEMKQLALADPVIQAKLKESGITKDAVIITHLFAKTLGKDDACDTHRCLILSFNTEDRVLDFITLVDLSTQRVINR